MTLKTYSLRVFRESSEVPQRLALPLEHIISTGFGYTLKKFQVLYLKLALDGPLGFNGLA